jgi:hypothetical protein
MKLVVELPGLGKAVRQVSEQLGKKAKPVFRAAANDGAKIIVKASRANLRGIRKAAGKEQKGLVDKAMGSRIKVYGDRVFIVIGARRGFKDPVTEQDPANIAHLIEGGRKEVRVKKKRLLSDGTTVYGLEVEAVAPHPFLRPALEDNRAAATAAVAARLARGLETGK